MTVVQFAGFERITGGSPGPALRIMTFGVPGIGKTSAIEEGQRCVLLRTDEGAEGHSSAQRKTEKAFANLKRVSTRSKCR